MWAEESNNATRTLAKDLKKTYHTTDVTSPASLAQVRDGQEMRDETRAAQGFRVEVADCPGSGDTHDKEARSETQQASSR